MWKYIELEAPWEHLFLSVRSEKRSVSASGRGIIDFSQSDTSTRVQYSTPLHTLELAEGQMNPGWRCVSSQAICRYYL